MASKPKSTEKKNVITYDQMVGAVAVMSVLVREGKVTFDPTIGFSATKAFWETLDKSKNDGAKKLQATLSAERKAFKALAPAAPAPAKSEAADPAAPAAEAPAAPAAPAEQPRKGPKFDYEVCVKVLTKARQEGYASLTDDEKKLVRVHPDMIEKTVKVVGPKGELVNAVAVGADGKPEMVDNPDKGKIDYAFEVYSSIQGTIASYRRTLAKPESLAPADKERMEVILGKAQEALSLVKAAKEMPAPTVEPEKAPEAPGLEPTQE